MIVTNFVSTYISDLSGVFRKRIETYIRWIKKSVQLIYGIDNLNKIFWQFNPNLIAMDMDTCLKSMLCLSFALLPSHFIDKCDKSVRLQWIMNPFRVESSILTKKGGIKMPN